MNPTAAKLAFAVAIAVIVWMLESAASEALQCSSKGGQLMRSPLSSWQCYDSGSLKPI